jgi:3-hydroxy-9,10-secoandrosta-1,3,5(10)-triene-9,17-dione monooxygenase reductase component
MGTHAARLPEICGHPHVTSNGHGITVNGVAMHSGLPPGQPDGAGSRTGPHADSSAQPVDGSRTDPHVESSALPVDGRRFRTVLGHFATGIVAITAIDPDNGEPCGLAANSFTSVSLDPPLVAFCVAHTSTSWPRLRAARTQTVNVLAEHQQAVCAALASKGGDKFAGLEWTKSPGGNPMISDALAWIDCSIEAEHPTGDHVIVVARVHDLGVHGDGGPLVFFRGDYGRFRT